MGLIKNNQYFKSLPKDVADVLEKFDPKKPIFQFTNIPTFRTNLEKEKYWATEFERWNVGYGGLPATLYFMATQGMLKNRITGGLERPVCRDVDLYLHTRLEIAKKQKRSAGILKGRGVGLSTLFGILANHTMLIKPGSNINMTSKDQPTLAKIFSDKLIVCYENLHKDIRPEEKNRNETKQTSYLAVKSEYVNQFGETKEGVSTIFARETSDSDKSASSFSGSGAALGLYDELPLHRRKNKLLNSSIECYRNPRTKELDGFLIWGGTVEDTLTNDDLMEFKKTVEKSDTWKSDIIFLDCLWGFQKTSTDYTGWTDWENGQIWYEKEIESMISKSDDEAIRSFKKNNPRSINDIFELAQGGYWEDDVASIAKQHYDELISIPEAKMPLVTGNIFRNGRKSTFMPSAKGFCEVIEQPKSGVKYFIGVDGAASQENTTNSSEKDRSKVSATVMKIYESPEGLNFAPVCQYTELPKQMEKCYEVLTALATWYNAKVHIESNQGQATGIVTYFINQNLEDYLFALQAEVGTHILKKKAIYGQYRTEQILSKQIDLGNIYLRKHCKDIFIPSLMYEIAFANHTDNFDRLSSFLTVLAIAWPLINKPIQKENKIQQFIEHPVMVRNQDGSWGWGMKRQYLVNPHEHTNNLLPDTYSRQ
jgi:hypothetical protein